MATEREEIVATFVAEAMEGLADIESQLLSIESAGAGADPDLVNRVFRAIHSIKGTAGFCGFASIGTLAHEMESLLNLLRSGGIQPTHAVIESLLRAADVLRQMVGDSERSGEQDIAGLVRDLRTAIDGGTSERSGTPGSPAPGDADEGTVDVNYPSGLLAFLMVPRTDLLRHQRAGRSVFIIEVDLIEHVERAGRDVVSFIADVHRSCEVVSSYVQTAGVGTLEMPLPSALMLTLLVASEGEVSSVAAKLSIPAGAVQRVARPEETDWSGESPRAPESKAASAETPLPPPVAGGEAGTAQSLRVSVRTLDSLVALAGELVLARNQLVRTVASRPIDPKAVEAVATRVDRITSGLQEAVMQTRMQPLGTVFSRFPRIVRDLSSRLGKECAIHIEGREVELDKSILEAISDPLTHLVRNAIDHGIESPERRIDAGKKAVGAIALRARHQGGKVIIEIADDGAGIDPERLRAKALEKGIMTPEQAAELSDRDALHLIFAPGFSTAERITEVSGRGVGMDVVRTNIEAMGGVVALESRVGLGATIRIELPLTLAIMPALLVRAGAARLAIPQTSIVELIRVGSDELPSRVQDLQGCRVLRLRGELIPIASLAEVIGSVCAASQSCDPQRAYCVLVLETGTLRYGLIVDAIEESQEIVVKPLGRHLRACSCYSGATILGDGSVAMIIDVLGAAAAANLLAGHPGDDAAVEESDGQAQEQTLPVLLFEGAEGEWFGIATSLVSRIERVRSDQVDTVGGVDILQYRGGSLPLIALERCIQSEGRPEPDSFHAVVFRSGGRDFGVIAPSLADIRDVPAEIDGRMLAEPGVLGSISCDDRTIRVLDVHALARRAHPGLFAAPSAESTCGRKRILLAEDSGFFRRQVETFLRESGFEVTAVADGAQALAALRRECGAYDLVLTDLDMPVMDGLALTRSIRAEIAFAGIPVIALTGLDGDGDREAGLRAGAVDYQVKLDRDALIASIHRHLRSARQHDREAA